jgi:Arrestin (or S-antigen), N-terminal domain/Arrestin (or S-antigen), C-terminal domain
MSQDQSVIGHNGIRFLLDKSFYLPGQRIQGQVLLDLKNETDVKSLAVYLNGIEDTHIYLYEKRGGTFKSNRTMANTGLWLSQQATIPEGTRAFPFVFDLPKDALPSYAGKHANVTWKLSAKASVGWRHDLEQEQFLVIGNYSSLPPAPVVLENPEAQPKIRLSLPSNVYQPGDTIDGKFTLLDQNKTRAVRIQLSMDEYAAGHGASGDRSQTETIIVGEPLVFSQDDLTPPQETSFRIPLLPQSPCSYKGNYSSIDWYLQTTLDIPHGRDINLNIPFQVALRTPQLVSAQPEIPISTVS